ncbi:MAG: hypothetical protein ACKO1U_02375 [Bacteroidota bacterium]
MRLLLAAIFLMTFFTAKQASAQQAEEETNILFRNEASGGIQLHSNGLGIQFRRGWHATGYKKTMLEFEFVSMRHPKQFKQANPYYPDSRPFFFGKLDFMYCLRSGIGRQQVLFSKAERSGVEVRYNYYGGITFGITKPVYLDILVDDPNDSLSQYKFIETRRYDPNDPDQKSIENIYGPGPYFMGFGELRLHPGVYGKFSLSFEYSTIQQKVTSLETGVIVDYLPSSVKLMADNDPQSLFVNFFVALSWGGKW